MDRSDERVRKRMNLKSGNIERYEQFSQFASLTEFNHHMEMWMLEHKQDFSKGELMGLKRLVRFAAKIPGVCNAKIGTVLKAIHDEYNENGISRSTFKRMTQKAKELGILTIYETERKNGSQTSNLYVFNRIPSNEPPKQEIMNHPKETSNLFKTKKQEITKRTEEHSELDHTYVSDRIPQPFVQLVKCFFPEANTIEEYWRMTQIAAYRNNSEKETDRVLEVALHSFKQLIRKLKFNVNIKNPIAYFYGILDKKFTQRYYEELYQRFGLYGGNDRYTVS
jgi:N-acetylglutamate synthase-like GNAT family acetyltransferase